MGGFFGSGFGTNVRRFISTGVGEGVGTGFFFLGGGVRAAKGLASASSDLFFLSRAFLSVGSGISLRRIRSAKTGKQKKFLTNSKRRPKAQNILVFRMGSLV
jgi:hypothetical protein